MEIISHTQKKWDKHMLNVAKLCSEMSKDRSTKVGAVIMGPNKRIVSTGYNGFPSNVPDYREWYENREIKYKHIIHAEENALTTANNFPKGSTLYVYPLFPCFECYKKISKSGIKRVVSVNHDLKDCKICEKDKICPAIRWKDSWDQTEKAMIKDECEYLFI